MVVKVSLFASVSAIMISNDPLYRPTYTSKLDEFEMQNMTSVHVYTSIQPSLYFHGYCRGAFSPDSITHFL